MRFVLLICLCFFLITIQGQSIKVVDINTHYPIHNVLVIGSSSKQTSLSEKNGVIQLSNFTTLDTLYFQHPTYNSFTIPRSNITQDNFIISLKEKVIELESFAVTANKWKEKRERVPNFVSKMDRTALSLSSPQTTADILQNSGKVFVQKSQQGGGSPMIRGFGANKVLYVLDGVRLNNAIYRSGNHQHILNIDPLMLEDIDVIFGPGAVFYGSDAMGGVFLFNSQKPKKDDHTDGNFLLRSSSANNEKTGHFHLIKKKNKLGLVTNISFNQYGNLKMGSFGPDEYLRNNYVKDATGSNEVISNNNPEEQVYTGIKHYYLTQKITYDFTPYLKLDYGYYLSSTSDNPRYDRLLETIDGNPKYAEWYYGPQTWMMNRLSIDHSKTNFFYDKSSYTTAWQVYSESRHKRKLNSDWLMNQNESLSIFTFNADYQKNDIMYGVEYAYNNLQSYGFQNNVNNHQVESYSSRYPDGNNYHQVLALYTLYQKDLQNNWLLKGGLRYNYFNLFSSFTKGEHILNQEIKNSNSALNGSFGVVKTLNTLSLYSNLSTGFHAPNFDGLTKLFSPSANSILVPNPGLRPEHIYNFEIGGRLAEKRWTTVEVNLYYSYLTNPMVVRYSTWNNAETIEIQDEKLNVIALVNEGSAAIYGFNVSATQKFNRNLIGEISLFYQEGEDNKGITLRHIAPIYGKFNFRYKKGRLRADFYGLFSGAKPNSKMAPSELDKPTIYLEDQNGKLYSPPWWTLNLKSSYSFSKNILVLAGIENILDKRYRPYSSGIVAPGRNFTGTIRYSF